MQRATISALVVVIGAAVYAMSRPDGFDRVGAGVLAGAFLGGAVGLRSHRIVGAALERDTLAAFQALIVGFAFKATGAILPWAVLSFMPKAQPLADPTAYLIAYASAILLVMCGGMLDHLRLSSEISAKQILAGTDGSFSPSGSTSSAVSTAVSSAVSTAIPSGGPSGASHTLESAS